VKYGVLRQTNPAYKPDLWTELDDLYVGGFQILDGAKKYIPRQIGESEERYKERLSLASYLNYLGMIVDAYASNLFAQEPVVAPLEGSDGGDAMASTPDAFWKEFADDANLRGDSFSKLLRCVFTTAALKERSLVGCDFPSPVNQAQTRAEEAITAATRACGFLLSSNGVNGGIA